MSDLYSVERGFLTFVQSITDYSSYTNVLFINKSVGQADVLYNSVNATTFPIIYTVTAKAEDVKTLLSRFNKKIRVAFAFDGLNEGNVNFLFNNKFVFTPKDISGVDPSEYSPNLQFMLDLISSQELTNLDFLACNTYNYTNWHSYYNILQVNNVIVGASSTMTGNNPTGDWIMESTSENISSVYFSENISNFTNLLWSGSGSSNTIKSTNGNTPALILTGIIQINTTPSGFQLFPLESSAGVYKTSGRQTLPYTIQTSDWPIGLGYSTSLTGWTNAPTANTPCVLTFQDDSVFQFTAANNFFIMIGNNSILNGKNNIIAINVAPGTNSNKITYDGFVDGSFIASNTSIQNIGINSGSTILSQNNGWICQENANQDNVLNCFSNGPISSYGGGIMGSDSSVSNIFNCYSFGAIPAYAGGICGANCASNYIFNCYSMGTIGTANTSSSNAGGIVGSAFTGYIFNCFTMGSLASNVSSSSCGGICGNIPSSSSSNTTNIINCYWTGSINNANGTNSNGSKLVVRNCYKGSSWSDNAAFASNALLNTNNDLKSAVPALSNVINAYANLICPLTNFNNIWIDIDQTVSNVPYKLSSFNTTQYVTTPTSIINNTTSVGIKSFIISNIIDFGLNSFRNYKIINSYTYTDPTTNALVTTQNLSIGIKTTLELSGSDILVLSFDNNVPIQEYSINVFNSTTMDSLTTLLLQQINLLLNTTNNLNTTTNSHGSSISNLNTNVNTNRSNIDANRTSIGTLNDTTSNHRNRLDNNDNSISTLNTNVNTNRSNIETNRSNIDANRASIGTLNDTTSNHRNRLDDNDNYIRRLNNDVSGQSSMLSNHDESIVNLRTTTSVQESVLSSHRNKLDDHERQFNDNVNTLSSHRRRLDDQDGLINENINTLSSHRGRLDEQNGLINDNVDTLRRHRREIEDHHHEIEETKNRCNINEALLNYIYEFIFNENSGITGFVGATGPFSLINELIYLTNEIEELQDNYNSLSVNFVELYNSLVEGSSGDNQGGDLFITIQNNITENFVTNYITNITGQIQDANNRITGSNTWAIGINTILRDGRSY